jgi:ubiquinone/menaquinone biosynthesis C-methylase UbiE
MANKDNELERSVKKANKELYDSAHASYEAVDGRRSEELAAWLKTKLLALRKLAPGGRLLDVGTGSGFLCRCASGIFEERAGTDLSQKILVSNLGAFDLAVCADNDRLPFRDNTFDAVACFAVLHHLYGFEKFVREAARILRPGGIFYTDHDMDLSFAGTFGLPLSIYRQFKNSRHKYEKLMRASERGERKYDLAEYQEKGIDTAALERLLGANGFTVSARFHWYGLNKFTNAVFGKREFPRGLAPLSSLTAIKK